MTGWPLHLALSPYPIHPHQPSHVHLDMPDSSSAALSATAASSPTSPTFPPLSPVPSDLGSPSASAFLRTEQTLEDLSRQLGQLSAAGAGEGTESDEGSAEDGCACGEGCGLRVKLALSGGALSWVAVAVSERNEAAYEYLQSNAKRGADEKLTSSEIGAALLQRCEALERKCEYEVKRAQHQVSMMKRRFPSLLLSREPGGGNTTATCQR